MWYNSAKVLVAQEHPTTPYMPEHRQSWVAWKQELAEHRIQLLNNVDS
jgi:hypothetical protein